MGNKENGLESFSKAGSNQRKLNHNTRILPTEIPIEGLLWDDGEEFVNIKKIQKEKLNLQADLASKEDVSAGAEEKNLLTVRKPSVGRAHSLPNDSYMLQTVEPSPWDDCQTNNKTCSYKDQAASTISVQSQPADTSYLLQVPKEPLHCANVSSNKEPESIPKLPPPLRSPSVQRMLRRQVAIRNDSLDLCGPESKENICCEMSETTALQSNSTSSQQEISSAQKPPPGERSSVHTQQHCHNQYNISRHPTSSCASLNPFEEMPTDLADEEVSKINTCKERMGLKPCRTSSESAGLPLTSKRNLGSDNNVTLKDLKKFYSVDTQGLLKKPSSWLDDPRRHSIEICSMENSPQHQFISSSSGFISEVLSEMNTLQASRQKKKWSPPCISIDPPDEQSLLSRTHLCLSTPAADNCLRRRAPSCESKDSVDIGDALLLDKTLVSALPTPKKDLITLATFSFDQTEMDQ